MWFHLDNASGDLDQAEPERVELVDPPGRGAWYRSRLSFSWRVDETYVRVKGCWKYLYRAIDKDGATLDFYLADQRNTKAAKQ